jgi:hypothetical protein
METVAIVRFAAIAGSDDATEVQSARKFRLRLADGSTITVDSAALGGDNDEVATVALADGAAPREVPLAQIAGIEQVNGPVSWLSSLTPAETIQRPFLEMTWPTRPDRTVTGDPIRFGQRTFTRGIGVHAYSSLTYELDGRYRAFRTQYAIDGSWPYANVTVRIKLDDRVVHEQADVRSGNLAPVITIPLENAKSLTLEVDYGQTYDVQDRFVWIEPALLRNVPTTQPR